MKTIETLDNRPFRRLITTIGALPTSFIDSMSYYEMLAWFCDFLQNTVIPAVNDNAEALAELQRLFVELKEYVDNYFDNLDVQDEINNKLDEMADNGTLEEIMASYLQTKAIFGFDTVADMKAATNFVNGSYAKTLGFSDKNDGGSATYKIRTATNDDDIDEKFIIEITGDPSNTLVAELITDKDSININQIGGKSDFAGCCNYLINKGYNVYVPKDTYTTSTPVLFNHENTKFICDGDITCTSNISLFMINGGAKYNVIKLNGEVIGHDTEGTRDSNLFQIGVRNYGIVSNMDIFINNASNFLNGILMSPDGGGHGVAYCNIKFNNIQADYGIHLKTGDTGANWVNENTFEGGRIDTNLYGIYFEPSAGQVDPYNGNKFYNIAVEPSSGTYVRGIKLDSGVFNFFEKIRLSEGLGADEKYVELGDGTFANVIQNESGLTTDKIQDNNTAANRYNIFNTRLSTSGGTWLANGFRTQGGVIFIPDNNLFNSQDIYASGYATNTLTLSQDCTCNRMSLDIGDATTSDMVYTLPKSFGKWGVTEFTIRIIYKSAGSTITIKDSDGNDVIGDAQIDYHNAQDRFLCRYMPRGAASTVRNCWMVTPLQ